MAREKIAIIGSGLIGGSWAMIFLSKGYNVSMFDVDEAQLAAAQKKIPENLKRFESQGNLRGEISADEQIKLITFTSDFAECIKDAIYVQECVPEKLELKRKIFEDLDKLCTDDMILASSASCIASSRFNYDLKHAKNMLIVHPVNPPYFVPLVEIIPSDQTRPEIVTKTRQLLEEVGQAPITLKKEIIGFALNRIQYAILNECWNMLQADLLNAEDVDRLMVHGLGMRYAFIGPLETMHLNAEGIVNYCDRYAAGALKVSETFQPPPLYDIPTAEKLNEYFSEHIPLEKLEERRKWRDECLAKLAKLKKEIPK